MKHENILQYYHILNSRVQFCSALEICTLYSGVIYNAALNHAVIVRNKPCLTVMYIILLV